MKTRTPNLFEEQENQKKDHGTGKVNELLTNIMHDPDVEEHKAQGVPKLSTKAIQHDILQDALNKPPSSGGFKNKNLNSATPG